MLSRLVSGTGGMRVRRLGGSRAGEMRITRFLRNPRVSVDEIFATAGARTAELAAGRHVLAIQDTTSLRDDGSGHSLNLHAMIGVDAANLAVLGLLHARVLERHGGEAQSRKTRPHADKQSHRWHEASTAAATLLGGGAGGAADAGANGGNGGNAGNAGARAVTVVADREGDIYEDFALRLEGVHLLVRAAQDRSLVEGGTLFGAHHLSYRPTSPNWGA